jgi:hypothetical protein
MESKAPTDKPGYFDNCLYHIPSPPLTEEGEKTMQAYLVRLRAMPSDPSVKRVIAETLQAMKFREDIQAAGLRAETRAKSTKENETA